MIPPAAPLVPNKAEGAGSTALGIGGIEGQVPRHVAIIMDGNGRWAERKGLPRAAGHRAGADAVRKVLQSAAEQRIEVLTLYAFSSENWRRSEDEISDLKGLMAVYLERELKTLLKEGVRLCLLGDYRAFGPELSAKLEQAVERTSDNRRLTLAVALNYGSRREITEAARTLAEEAAAGCLDPARIDEQAIADRLDTAGLPPLDLLIRTSGEVRLSNFLLWQAAYAELLFLDILWPDFGEPEFTDCLARFAARQRRFGGR